uniref:NADH-ubiquinone oxidoreductase chain 5 n=1 Tax=Stenopsocus capacimacularus TaxID=3074939 RepID=A0AAU7VAY5_9NEOP
MVISSLLFLMSASFMIIFINLSLYNKIYFIDWEILVLNTCSVSMNILIDWMSSLFMSFVLLISFVIVIYSISYMSGDPNSSFFILLVFSFVLSMMLLIISPNLISILLGWDGLGLISYCLVIYYQNVKSYNAGMVTAMTNRIGDVLILMSIAWMANFGSWNYYIYMIYEKNLYLIIGALIIMAAMTKSAQIPFSSWLPAAMAAPTPVSALVHSSTLVTAGVYLLIRFNEVLINYYLCQTLLLISVLTMFMSGLGAIFEHDLKKIIALSTLSQLGLMISSLCLGFTEFAFFHLLTHALFKSLLFMCAGYIIHGMNDSQDIRYMGNIVSQSPLLSIYFTVSNLALCGMPFLAGFYSKDIILEMIFMSNTNIVIISLYFIATFFTVVYTFRLIYFSMVNSIKLSSYNSFSDNDYGMLGYMYIIQFMVVIGGSMLTWMIFIDFNGIYLPPFLKMFTLVLCLLGVICGVILGQYSMLNLEKNFSSLYYNYLGEMWFMPYLSTYSINWSILKLGYAYSSLVDLGWGERVGGQGIFNILINLNNKIYINQNKNLMIFIYLLLLLILLFLFI